MNICGMIYATVHIKRSEDKVLGSILYSYNVDLTDGTQTVKTDVKHIYH